MSLEEASSYFNCLMAYLNHQHYGLKKAAKDGQICLSEKLIGSTKPQEVHLYIDGQVLGIKLDAKGNSGSSNPLFHFLNNEAKPWSKRCDFVVFNLRGRNIFVYCIEFKSEGIPPDVKDQLDASLAWCKALHASIFAYTNKKHKLQIKKFVFSQCPEDKLSAYLDENNKYLKRDHTIRHYLYSEVDKMSLHDLENTNIEIIRG